MDTCYIGAVAKSYQWLRVLTKRGCRHITLKPITQKRFVAIILTKHCLVAVWTYCLQLIATRKLWFLVTITFVSYALPSDHGLPWAHHPAYFVFCVTSQLQQATRVFMQHARGPACDKYLKQLEATCLEVWRDGRQLCEEVSITGNHCIHQLHRLPGDEETDENGELPVMSHVSQLKTRGTCNCGSKQMDRDDPFDHKVISYV